MQVRGGYHARPLVECLPYEKSFRIPCLTDILSVGEELWSKAWQLSPRPLRGSAALRNRVHPSQLNFPGNHDFAEVQ